MSDELKAKWDARYRESGERGEPARVLTDYAHLLPASGSALDLACGLGANALFMARHGLRVTAWDLSPVAIERLAADARDLPLTAEVRDLAAVPPPPDTFDVVVVSHYLERALAPAIAASLRPGGLLFYQTFSRLKVTPHGPSNPEFRLADNELLRLFPGLHVRAYREEGRLGDIGQGLRDEALLVAERVA